MRFDQNIPKL